MGVGGEGDPPLKFWYICAAHLQKAEPVKITKNGGGQILGYLKMGQ